MKADRLGKGRAVEGAALLLALLATLNGCKGSISSLPLETTIPPNTCTSADAALNDPNCQLTLGEWVQGYIATPEEQVWYGAKVGALDARSIGHVIAGYYPPADPDAGWVPPPYADGSPYWDGGTAPNCQTDNFNTAVNLTLNVLHQDGLTSVTTAADLHGAACPLPMDTTFRYTQSDTSLILVLADNSGAGIDTKNKYSLWVDMLEDPDTNEPNDTPQTATPIQLTTGGGGVESGQNGGYLATPGDLDYFVVQSPGENYVLWIEVSQDPSSPSPSPYPFRLQYNIYGPDGVTQITTGQASIGAQHSTALVAIGTAVLLDQAGPYYILVDAYTDQNTVGAIPGSLTYKYLLQAIIVPLQDPTEGTAPPYNNSFAAAYPVNGGTPIALGGSATVTGRTSYVADQDWYSVTLAPNPALGLLHYKLTPNQSVGRFPALPTNPDRDLFVYTQVSDPTSCLTDAGVCVISAAGGSTALNIAEGACNEAPSKCLQSYRVEALPTDPAPALPNLRNFESMLQVPPHAAAVTYYFFLQPNGDLMGNDGYWADDRDYTILFEHLAEPDALEQIPDPIRLAALAPTPGAPLAAVPVYLSFGVGQPNPNIPPNGVIVGANDYDGRGDDVDSYQISLPFNTEQAWQISWSVPTTDGTDPDYDLGFTLAFCNTNPDAGTGTPPCYAMVTAPQDNSSGQLGLAYSTGTFDSWWNQGESVIPDQVLYNRTVSAGVVTTTVTPYGCFCFQPNFVTDAGTSYFVMNLFPLNRTSWNLVPYTVSTASAPYPYAFNDTAGTSITCPDPCNFTAN